MFDGCQKRRRRQTEKRLLETEKRGKTEKTQSWMRRYGIKSIVNIHIHPTYILLLKEAPCKGRNYQQTSN
jgi:hypothetical protein